MTELPTCARAVELEVADLVRMATRETPVSISDLRRRTGHSERSVKGIIEVLRHTYHMPIGARRTAPFGYFLVRTAEEAEEAVEPYRQQVISMWKTLRALYSPRRLREFHGQLPLGESEKSDD